MARAVIHTHGICFLSLLSLCWVPGEAWSICNLAQSRWPRRRGRGWRLKPIGSPQPLQVLTQAPRSAGAQDLAWLEGNPDLGLSLVPDLRQDHGRRAGYWPAAGLPATHGLRHPPAPSTLRSCPGLPLQVGSASPSAPEEAWIRCHQEPSSQQGNGPGLKG